MRRGRAKGRSRLLLLTVPQVCVAIVANRLLLGAAAGNEKALYVLQEVDHLFLSDTERSLSLQVKLHTDVAARMEVCVQYRLGSRQCFKQNESAKKKGRIERAGWQKVWDKPESNQRPIHCNPCRLQWSMLPTTPLSHFVTLHLNLLIILYNQSPGAHPSGPTQCRCAS